MKTTFISKENNDVKFTMEFTAEELESAKVSVYQEQKGKFEIDGFRKGKAPRSIIEKKYGEGIFAEDAINDLLEENYMDALKELELDVIDRPRVEFGPLNKGEGFVATLTVAVYPEIVIKDYMGVEVEEEKAEVTAEDVEKEIEQIRHRNARMVSVDREVKEGDTVILDYKGFVGETQFEGGTAENYSLVIGSGTFIPGFEEQLVGAKKEEGVDVKVTFPEEYHSDELAGKEAIFQCLIHDIKEEELPELDDEFAKDISEFDTMEEFKAFTEGRLLEAKDRIAHDYMKDTLLNKVAEANDFDVPDVMVEDEVSAMLQEFDQQLRMQGMDLNTYMQYLGQDMSTIREDMKISGFRRVKNRMIMKAIAAQENVEVSEEEVEIELNKMAAQFQTDVEKLKEMLGDENITYFKNDIRMNKTLEMMLDAAKIVPKKEEEKEEVAEEK